MSSSGRGGRRWVWWWWWWVVQQRGLPGAGGTARQERKGAEDETASCQTGQRGSEEPITSTGCQGRGQCRGSSRFEQLGGPDGLSPRRDIGHSQSMAGRGASGGLPDGQRRASAGRTETAQRARHVST
ncbi:uncharacterized protein B0I36DRAFT_108621 [Microdochium trichocladiopsis]|uniref:Secreted protein n=1 Tax=Microdochium trichocladiopsis TaxID=1682393 RepID=A0A9P8YA51_9PEZI|nr:uncharacterized protein B0I36DRAFT_108621 [Microdochium trichocladiopsis]KAH7033406.1 hypothetical protein B0I36DRAFT_108621 [Microdochium trichocladiopsis]